jgi:hypothetical protein
MRRLPMSALAAMFMLPSSAGHAQDCPSAQSAPRGFVVERGDKQKTDVSIGDDGVVRTTMRYAGQPLLETSLFAGLFSLSRLDRGRRVTYTPLTDLKTLFPLKVGQKALAVFDYTDAGKTMPLTILLRVKGQEPLSIGPRTYTLLKIEHSEARGEGSAPRRLYTDYYSPDLKLVLMKEYKEPDGRSTFVKYDKVYLTHDEPTRHLNIVQKRVNVL